MITDLSEESCQPFGGGGSGAGRIDGGELREIAGNAPFGSVTPALRPTRATVIVTPHPDAVEQQRDCESGAPG